MYFREAHLDPEPTFESLDPVALRRRNLISRFPYRSGLGVTIDCGRFGANLEEMAQRVLADGFAARRRAAAERGRLRGLGIAEIEIDPETGAVTLERYLAIDDYGRLINPMLTRGQVQGGVTQGIGQAMLEHTVYDWQSGQLLSGSFTDYALPRADDLPPFDITLAELPTAVNQLGVKGPGRLHGGTADHHQRNPRCAGTTRRHRYPHAGHPGTGVARDPQRTRRLINSGQPELLRLSSGPSRRRCGRHSRAKPAALDQHVGEGCASGAKPTNIGRSAMTSIDELTPRPQIRR